MLVEDLSFDDVRVGAPAGEQPPGGDKVWLLHLSERLLIETLVVGGNSGPFAQEGSGGAKDVFCVFSEKLTFRRARMKLQLIGTSLEIEQPCLMHNWLQ